MGWLHWNDDRQASSTPIRFGLLLLPLFAGNKCCRYSFLALSGCCAAVVRSNKIQEPDFGAATTLDLRDRRANSSFRLTPDRACLPARSWRTCHLFRLPSAVPDLEFEPTVSASLASKSQEASSSNHHAHAILHPKGLEAAPLFASSRYTEHPFSTTSTWIPFLFFVTLTQSVIMPVGILRLCRAAYLNGILDPGTEQREFPASSLAKSVPVRVSSFPNTALPSFIDCHLLVHAVPLVLLRTPRSTAHYQTPSCQTYFFDAVRTVSTDWMKRALQTTSSASVNTAILQ